MHLPHCLLVIPPFVIKLVEMKYSPRSFVILGLWGFLLGWTYQAIGRYLKEETVFNHYDKANAFQWPVVNICPMYVDLETKKVPLTSFEDVEAEIHRTLTSYSHVKMVPIGKTVDNPEE